MLEDTLKKLIENEGLILYDTEIVKENEQDIFRVYISCKNGVSVDMCAKISNIISPIIDLEPPIKGKYFLEVSSPGLERKLKKPQHFLASIGEILEIKTKDEKIIGKLIKADENSVTLENDDNSYKINYKEILIAKTYVQW